MHALIIGLIIAVIGAAVVALTLVASANTGPGDEYVPRHKAGADTGPVDQ